MCSKKTSPGHAIHMAHMNSLQSWLSTQEPGKMGWGKVLRPHALWGIIDSRLLGRDPLFSSVVYQWWVVLPPVNNIHPCSAEALIELRRSHTEKRHKSRRGWGEKQQDKRGTWVCAKMTKIRYINVWNCQAIRNKTNILKYETTLPKGFGQRSVWYIY